MHNEDEVARKDVRSGDTVVVQRAGDVIPQLVRVVEERRPKAPSATDAGICPVCGSHAVREINEKTGDPKQPGAASTRSPVRRRPWSGSIISPPRYAFDIEGLGEKRRPSFSQDGLLKEPADIFCSSALRQGAKAIAARRGLGRNIGREIVRRHQGPAENSARPLHLSLAFLMSARHRQAAGRAISTPRRLS